MPQATDGMVNGEVDGLERPKKDWSKEDFRPTNSLTQPLLTGINVLIPVLTIYDNHHGCAIA